MFIIIAINVFSACKSLVWQMASSLNHQSINQSIFV